MYINSHQKWKSIEDGYISKTFTIYYEPYELKFHI